MGKNALPGGCDAGGCAASGNLTSRVVNEGAFIPEIGISGRIELNHPEKNKPSQARQHFS
jgi:hypothetical protein